MKNWKKLLRIVSEQFAVSLLRQAFSRTAYAFFMGVALLAATTAVGTITLIGQSGTQLDLQAQSLKFRVESVHGKELEDIDCGFEDALCRDAQRNYQKVRLRR